jgi:hypothetical protein
MDSTRVIRYQNDQEKKLKKGTLVKGQAVRSTLRDVPRDKFSGVPKDKLFTGYCTTVPAGTWELGTQRKVQVIAGTRR